MSSRDRFSYRDAAEDDEYERDDGVVDLQTLASVPLLQVVGHRERLSRGLVYYWWCNYRTKVNY